MNNTVQVDVVSFQKSQNGALFFSILSKNEPNMGVAGSEIAFDGKFENNELITKEGHLIVKIDNSSSIGLFINKQGNLIFIGNDADKYEVVDGRLIYNEG